MVFSMSGEESKGATVSFSGLNHRLLESSFEFFSSSLLNNFVADFHREIISLVSPQAENNRLCFVAPRGHGKSELLGVGFPLWRAFHSKTPLNILIVSATEKQAVHLLDRVKFYVESVPLLRDVLRPNNVHQTKWGGTEIRFKNGCRVAAYALGPSIRHEHPDLIVCDDILRDEIGSNASTKNIFYEVVVPAADAAQLVVIGTPQSFIDLLSELKGNDSWVSRTWRAVEVDEATGKRTALFPELLPLEKLDEIKASIPSVSWSKEYLCEPISSGSSLFPWALIEKSIDKSLTNMEEGKKSKDYFLGVDVALSDADSADRTVFVVGEETSKGLVVRKVEVRKGWSSDRIFQRCLDLHSKFVFKRALVEQVGLSYDLANELMKHPLTRSSFEGFKTSRTSKENILGGLEIVFRNGALSIPKHDILIEELLSFGVKEHSTGKQTFEALGAHDDTVSALALMVEASKGQRGTVSLITV